MAEELYVKAVKHGKWIYYTNDEGKARWKCSLCGKICKKAPFFKLYCSNCGARNQTEE